MATRPKLRKGRLTPAQSRAARRLRRSRRRRLVRWSAFSAVALVAFLFIFALFAPGLRNLSFTRGGPDGPGQRLSLPDGYQRGATTHVQFGESHPPYNSKPASSGWHYGGTTSWGIHEEAIADENLVHNLEHGGIRVHYNCPEGCDELVNQLAAVVNRALDENLKVLMSPYPDMDTTIALTAWTFIDQFDQFDEKRVRDFIRAHESSPNSPEPNAR